jgi:hypothetical protein
MILMAVVAINGNGDRDRGGGDDGRNGRNGDNSDGSGRDGIDWEVAWMEGTDGKEMMLAMVELGMEVTAEDI